MSRSEREKGRKGEAEVRRLFAAAGFTVRGLEGAGDHLAIGHGLTIHSEVKRQEVLRLPLWCRQAVAEAPRGALPLVSYRRSRERWQALAPEKAIARLLEQAGWRSGIHYHLRLLSGEWWAAAALEELLAALAGRGAALEAALVAGGQESP